MYSIDYNFVFITLITNYINYTHWTVIVGCLISTQRGTGLLSSQIHYVEWEINIQSEGKTKNWRQGDQMEPN